MASPVCAIESSRSLRCVVRNVWRVSSSSNCSIAIMLTGAEPVDLLLEVGDDLLGRRAAPTRRTASAPSGALGGRAALRLVFVARRARRLRPAACRRDELAGLVHAGDLGDDLVERRADRFDASGAEVVQIGAGGRARDLGLHHVAAHAFEVLPAPYECRGRASVNRCAQFDHALVEVAQLRLRADRASATAASSRCSVSTNRLAQFVAPDVGAGDVGAASGDSAPRGRAAASSSRATSLSSAAARSTSAACSVRAIGHESRAALRRPRAPTAAGSSRSRDAASASRCCVSCRSIAATASSRRSAVARSSSSARWRSVVTTSRRRCTRASSSEVRLDCASNPTIDFSWPCCSACSAVDGGLARRDDRVETRDVGRKRPRLGARRSARRREAPASRRGFRGCRGRPAAIRPARARRRGRLRRPAWPPERRRCARGRARFRTCRQSARGRSGAQSPPPADPTRARRSTSARAPGGTTSGGSGSRRLGRSPRARGSRSGRRRVPRAAPVPRVTSSAVFDEHVLQQIAEQRVHRALVGALDDQMVGDRAMVATRGAALAEQEACRVAERRAAGFELFERSQARFLGREIALARGERLAQRDRDRRAAGSGASSASASARPSRSSSARLRVRQRLLRDRVLVARAFGFGRRARVTRCRAARARRRRDRAPRPRSRAPAAAPTSVLVDASTAARVESASCSTSCTAPSGAPVVGLARPRRAGARSASAACDARRPPRAARRAPVVPARGGPRDRAASAANAAACLASSSIC